MKRLLFIIPLALLFLLNACGAVPTQIPPDQGTAFARWQTEVASKWTPTLTPTYDPTILAMISGLNADFHSDGNALESTMDADYSVTDIDLQPIPNNQSFIFRVDVNCSCKNNAECCLPERTFVLIVESIKKQYATMVTQFYGNYNELMVVTFDAKTRSQIGAITASWQNVRGYLLGQETGWELGVQVTRTIAPTMHP